MHMDLKYQYCLFDLDGTLTDPAIGITNSVMYALEKFGIHVADRSELFPFIGPPLTEMFTQIFAGMMNQGLLRQDDPALLAFAYTAPISALIHLCDREPEKIEEAMAQVEAFSRHFIRMYGVTDHA